MVLFISIPLFVFEIIIVTAFYTASYFHFPQSEMGLNFVTDQVCYRAEIKTRYLPLQPTSRVEQDFENNLL